MTDITDQDRRVAHEWAASIDPEMDCWSASTRAVARIVLATVDAPEPTLAEELARIAENSPVWTIQNVCDELKSAAARAEQMERERNTLEQQRDYWYDSERQAVKDRDHLAAEIDKANTDILHLTAERDEAHAEVERLTAERDEATVAPEENVAPDQQANTQEILAGSLPDPADVKPGEAWLVGLPGAPGIGVRNCPHTDFPWTVVEDEGHVRLMDSCIVLRSRLVPAPRVITNADELDRAKRCTIILDSVGVVCERAVLGDGWFTTQNGTEQTPYIKLPVTVLWEPGA